MFGREAAGPIDIFAELPDNSPGLERATVGVDEIAGSNPVAPTMAFVPREVMTNGNA